MPMLAPSYTFHADPARGMLVVVLSGFFGERDMPALAADRAAAHEGLRTAPNDHVTLVDVTACKIQPQTIVDSFARIIAAPRYRARRLAFVTGGSLARMQIRRIANGLPGVACFDDVATATDWLLAPEAPETPEAAAQATA